MMLTADDKDEIKRIVVETLATSAMSFSGENQRAGEIDQADTLLNTVDVTARAIEVFGTREKALRWLKTPVRSLGDRTPLSLLNSAEGAAQVQDTLGRVEHGVW
jgi:putative toxin-antitoxin system antitoxin component (TIGR02293 family)